MGSKIDIDLTVPGKTREVQNHHQDSTVWNEFEYRDGDVVVATWGKAGTTWTQQIVGQLLHNGDPALCPAQLSPWFELRAIPKDVLFGIVNSQEHRRFVKTHLPADALAWSPKAKYIFVARDGRDVIWSLHHHMTIALPAFWEIINDTPGRVGPPLAHPPADPRDLLMDLIEDDTKTTIPWPYWSLIRSWWALRNQPNVLLVHFNDLKKDLDGEMRRIAAFLGTNDMTEAQWEGAVKHCGFDWMKEHADQFAPPQSEDVFEGGAKNFINKGSNGRWTEVLSDEDNKLYLDKSEHELGKECADWIRNGGHP